MSEASILVVDDVPVNRKLTDIVLRREGFDVRTAATADEALAALPSFRPNLMLVDLNLPDTGGFQLARRVKGEPSTSHIVVIGLSGMAGGGDARQAIDAGCDGFLAKPVDSASLVASIREQLKALAAEAGANSAAADADAAPEVDIHTLRKHFLEDAAAHTRRILETIDNNFDAEQASRLVHQWVGAAGILGYLKASNLAGEVEAMLRGSVMDRVYLKELFSDLLFAFSGQIESLNRPVPESVRETLAGKAVGVVAFGPEDADRVCAALGEVGARPRLFSATEAPDSPAVRDCSVVLVQVGSETSGGDWLKPETAEAMASPFVLAGRREDIMCLHIGVQTRAAELLIDGWPTEEALMRLSLAIQRGVSRSRGAVQIAESHPEPPLRPASAAEVLIADDDAITRSAVRLALEEYGIPCRLAANGVEALAMIRNHVPAAAVLDVNMPGMDGYLVTAAVRQESLPVHIVLLTARSQEADISRGFNLGADDYIVKPFKNLELVARVRRLLRR